MSDPAPRLFVDDRPAARHGGAWVVEETHSLRLELSDGPWQVRVEGRALPWDATAGPSGGVRLDLPFAVGRLAVELSREDVHYQDTIEVRPASHKLGADTWAALLGELEAWLPSVTAGIEAPRAGGLSLEGLDLPSAVEALLPLLPGFEGALRQVYARPRTRERTDYLDRPIHRARQARADTLAWISRHPREAAWLRPEADPFLVGDPPLVPLPVQRDVLDHPANRHLVWLLGRIVSRLERAARDLGAMRCSELNDTRPWRDARVNALGAAARRLRWLHRTGPLREVAPRPASSEALMVLLDAPAYARAHQLGRRILTSGFATDAPAAGVATRPTFSLYELWCLLALQRALADWLGPDFLWSFTGTDALLNLSGDGAGACFTASGPEGRRLQLHFNLRFNSLLDGEGARFSLTRRRRPDVVLTVQGPEGCGWFALDAKYRAGRTALADAFGKAHIYQHSLRWPALGGAPAATWLLVPREDGARRWFSRAFLERAGVGAMALLPGGDLARATMHLRRMIAPMLEVAL